MKKSILFICFLWISLYGFSQEKKMVFPNDFLGTYSGMLKIENKKGIKKIPMEFHLIKTESVDKFSYILVYNNTPRNYTLIVKDLEKGIFEVDENNGIILPTKFANNTLYSFFEVQGNFLSSRLEFSENSIDFEILFSLTADKKETGNKKIEKDKKKIPKVFGYPISTVQKAYLRKVDN